MKQLLAWLGRRRTDPPESLRDHQFRLVVSTESPFALDSGLIVLEPLQTLAGRPGDATPKSSLLLRFRDSTDLGPDSFVVASDIAALLCLTADRRIDIAMESTVRTPQSPQTHFHAHAASVDPSLHGPLLAGVPEAFADYLSRLPSLEPKDLDAISAATNLHHGAALLAEHDFRSAYVLLVAALEVLSRTFGSPPSDWASWEDSSTWDKLFGELQLSVEASSRLRQRLLADKHLRLRATFQEYGSTTLPESFWSGKWRTHHYAFHVVHGTWSTPFDDEHDLAKLVPRDRTVLRQALGHSYNLRSGLVHQGKSLGLLDSGIRRDLPISATDPLPFAILRAITSCLIRHELLHHSTPFANSEANS